MGNEHSTQKTNTKEITSNELSDKKAASRKKKDNCRCLASKTSCFSPSNDLELTNRKEPKKLKIKNNQKYISARMGLSDHRTTLNATLVNKLSLRGTESRSKNNEQLLLHRIINNEELDEEIINEIKERSWTVSNLEYNEDHGLKMKTPYNWRTKMKNEIEKKNALAGEVKPAEEKSTTQTRQYNNNQHNSNAKVLTPVDLENHLEEESEDEDLNRSHQLDVFQVDETKIPKNQEFEKNDQKTNGKAGNNNTKKSKNGDNPLKLSIESSGYHKGEKKPTILVNNKNLITLNKTKKKATFETLKDLQVDTPLQLAKIQLTNSKSKTLKGTIFEVDQLGAIDGRRKTRDSIAYFGVEFIEEEHPSFNLPKLSPQTLLAIAKYNNDTNQTYNKESASSETILNDFVIASTPRKTTKAKKMFGIRFDSRTKKFLLKGLEKKTPGVFLKIEQPLRIIDQRMISFGQTCIILKISYEVSSEPTMHSTKPRMGYTDFEFISNGFLTVGSAKEVRSSHYTMGDKPRHASLCVNVYKRDTYVDSFTFFWWVSPIVKIGRDYAKNHVHVADPLASKIQCSVKFIPDEDAWVIFDGFGGKASTNSTWYYVDGEVELVNGLVWKSCTSTFVVLEDGRGEADGGKDGVFSRLEEELAGGDGSLSRETSDPNFESLKETRLMK